MPKAFGAGRTDSPLRVRPGDRRGVNRRPGGGGGLDTAVPCYPCYPDNPRCSETFWKILENFDLQIPEKDGENNKTQKHLSKLKVY